MYKVCNEQKKRNRVNGEFTIGWQPTAAEEIKELTTGEKTKLNGVAAAVTVFAAIVRGAHASVHTPSPADTTVSVH